MIYKLLIGLSLLLTIPSAIVYIITTIIYTSRQKALEDYYVYIDSLKEAYGAL